jgi:integrase
LHGGKWTYGRVKTTHAAEDCPVVKKPANGEIYVRPIRRFVQFSKRHHFCKLGKIEIEAFLTRLAVDRKVSASTQNQAFNALLFLYREVLALEMPQLDTVQRAKKSKRLPVVLSPEEVQQVLSQLDGKYWIAGNLLYGSGLRLLECLRLRVQDIDFGPVTS